MSAYVWDSYDTYRLRQLDLERFLADTFGEQDFHVSVEAGIYRFQVPRALEQAERNELADKRVEEF
ncbi:hypothetical protein GQ44DRAFT_777491 [Phaeosphaeriaceae sp. PMI808]|nr:hypothetical protein GQ44DRAFT_777491 [Phaeosphaeriaceae sp. PMI808]